jgi:hypothetical protein
MHLDASMARQVLARAPARRRAIPHPEVLSP